MVSAGVARRPPEPSTDERLSPRSSAPIVQPNLIRVPRARVRAIRRVVPTSKRDWGVLLLVAILAAGAVATVAVATDAFGAGGLYERLLAKIDRTFNPPPDRATLPTVVVTPKPATPEPVVTPQPTLASYPANQPPPTPAPTPTPIPRVPVDVDIVSHHGPEFAHELRDTWCSPAGVTTALAILGLGAPTDARETEIASRVREWESYADSHNGDWGPAAMALAMDAYGASGYKVVAYETRADALRGAAKAILDTNSPALLLAWRGAHTWVMTGFRADADPRDFDDAKVSGAYIDDPWYPWVSSIWGASDKPGTFQDAAEMKRNFLPWKRPEGVYPARDGNFIVVLPTVPRP